MNKEYTIFEALLIEAEYAQNMKAETLLHQVFGKAEMAFKLGAITSSQFLKLNTETLDFLYSNCQ